MAADTSMFIKKINKDLVGYANAVYQDITKICENIIFPIVEKGTKISEN